MPDFKSRIEKILTSHFGKEINVKNIRELSGGCINNALKVNTSGGNFFVKYNTADHTSLFETEAMGLKLLKETQSLDIPEVITYGRSDAHIYLILEYIEPAPQSKPYWEDFGISLAGLHRNSQSMYGLHFDNFIGSLRQNNKLTDDWISFFVNERLEPQIKMGIDSGKIPSQVHQYFKSLYKLLPQILYSETPALLHGDLWSGNVMVNEKGNAVLIDPAVYYGHREMELAFTTLFGGFDIDFYNSYMESFPLEDNFEERFEIYNLYPLLVHINLFGGGYLNSVVSILRRFIR
ncbi:MAG: fructosamine kinase family protein [Cytophagaceae bacterium]|nr:fructosamine kinase family protein [Cytophagaceae bacterium]